MSVETIARMTQSEFKEMLETVVEATVERTLLEMLGDPDEGLAIRSDVRKRLLRQRQEVAAGQKGQPFDDVVRQLGLDQHERAAFLSSCRRPSSARPSDRRH